jgi:Acetyltransferase (GNAT) domain
MPETNSTAAVQSTIRCTFSSGAKTGVEESLEHASSTANPFALRAAMTALLPDGHPATALECWDEKGAQIGVWPMHIARPIPGMRSMRVPNAPLYETAGTPVIAHGREQAVLEAMIRHLRDDPRLPSVIFAQSMLAEGPVWEAMQMLALQQKIGLDVIETWQRSILERAHATSAQEYLSQQISARKRKMLRRKRRKLEAISPATLVVNKEQSDIPAAFIRYCQTEDSGWKGRNQTSLSHHPADARYFRDLLISLAANQRAFIAELVQSGRTIASGLFVCSGHEVVFMRTAYEETSAALSPGVLLDWMVTEHLFQNTDFTTLDSSTDSAINPDLMLWPQRRIMAHVVIDCRSSSLTGKALTAYQRTRLQAKQQKIRLLGRR